MMPITFTMMAVRYHNGGAAFRGPYKAILGKRVHILTLLYKQTQGNWMIPAGCVLAEPKHRDEALARMDLLLAVREQIHRHGCPGEFSIEDMIGCSSWARAYAQLLRRACAFADFALMETLVKKIPVDEDGLRKAWPVLVGLGAVPFNRVQLVDFAVSEADAAGRSILLGDVTNALWLLLLLRGDLERMMAFFEILGSRNRSQNALSLFKLASGVGDKRTVAWALERVRAEGVAPPYWAGRDDVDFYFSENVLALLNDAERATLPNLQRADDALGPECTVEDLTAMAMAASDSDDEA